MAISNVSSSSPTLPANSGTPPLSSLSFDGLDSMEKYLFSVGNTATEKYRKEFEADGKKEMTVDQLKEMLKKRFAGYTLTDSEPKEPVKGKNLLYIDDTNMKKMATDADYRAKVMGLMEREYAGTSSMTFNLEAGSQKTFTTGSVFSVSETNPSVDGVPYAGMASSESVMEAGPSDSPLPPDFLSKTATVSSNRHGSAAWLTDLVEKRQAEFKEAQKRAAAEDAQKKASEERAGRNGVDIVV